MKKWKIKYSKEESTDNSSSIAAYTEIYSEDENITVKFDDYDGTVRTAVLPVCKESMQFLQNEYRKKGYTAEYNECK